MTNLRELYLADNFHSGSVPVEICARGLEKMKVTCELVECSSCSGSDIGGGEVSGSDTLVDLIMSNSLDQEANTAPGDDLANDPVSVSACGTDANFDGKI
jgi:hypothetical protein